MFREKPRRMRPLPQKVVEGLPTKSAKIRALAEAGFARTEIAEFLKIKYQHVRNVLVQSGIPTTPKASAEKGAISAKTAIELWPLERLLASGFVLVGECESRGLEAFAFSASAPPIAGVYAFAVDGLVHYVGLSRSGLQTTMGQYVYGHAKQLTRARVKCLILECLAEGRKVSLAVAHPPPLEWNGLPVEGAPGLEAGLIRLIRPPWNVQGAN